MDKGWGLTLDSSSSSLAFLQSKQPNTSLNSVSKLSHRRNDNMFMGQGFPVNFGRSSRDEHGAPVPSDDGRKAVVSEVDFFSDRTKSAPVHHHDEDNHRDLAKTSISIKKENSQSESASKSKLDVNTGLQLLTANTGSDQSMVDDGVSSEAGDKRARSTELAQLQAEFRRMNAENQKLKEMLTHVSSNYSALQIQLMALLQQQHDNPRTDSTDHEVVDGKAEEKKPGVGEGMVPRQFIDLGPSGPAEVEDQVSNSSSDERTRSVTPRNNNGKGEIGREGSPDSESQGWGPNKLQKSNPSNAVDQPNAEATMRKVRVSVRARSEAPMISDGCQWRKYGQKMAKGNPCPRAYYRCTMAVGCPVRKQVQRCAEDRTILITTYEGTHNHPLPPAAMAMASTTSAAASMLLSGSMSSADGIMNPNLLARAIFPSCSSSSMATLSASAPFPTVTLDLTHNSQNPLMQFQRPNAPFHVPFQGQPQGFGSGPTPFQFPHAISEAIYNQSKFSGVQLSQDYLASSSQLLAHQAPRTSLQAGQQQSSLGDPISAATAAITADPNFTAVLAAAISSILGGAQPNNNNNNNSSSNPNISTSNAISSFSGN